MISRSQISFRFGPSDPNHRTGLTLNGHKDFFFFFLFLSTYFACSEVQFINLPVGIRIPFLNLTFEFVLKLITNIFLLSACIINDHRGSDFFFKIYLFGISMVLIYDDKEFEEQLLI